MPDCFKMSFAPPPALPAGHVLAPTNFSDWMAWGAVVIPLFAFAFSACLYVWNGRTGHLNAEASRVQELITIVNNAHATEGLAVMLMAVSELERYRRYRAAIIRAVRALLEHQKQSSPDSPLIPAENELITNLAKPRFPWGRRIV